MDKICFTINDKKYEVGGELYGSTTLNSFIRNQACLPGTKAMCHEGGCGACIVSVRATNVRGDEETFSVNSCLVSIFSCDGWKIKTIEGLGSRKTGYHPMQDRLAKFNGSQCGYCSCAWIMNLYSLYEQNNKNLTMKQIERSFGGNTCRCTGYRPILDTLKSFAVDRSEQLTDRLRDIEDLSNVKSCAKTGQDCTKSCADYDDEHSWCVVNMDRALDQEHSKPIFIDLKEYKYYKVFSINDIYNVWDKEGTDSYMLLAGNTAKGIFRSYEYPRVWIDINGIDELKANAIDVNLVVGGATTLTKLMELFRKTAETEEYFWYLPTLVDHIDLVAHVPVRNLGTIAGNLMLKHRDRSFPSDIFVLLETVGAMISIVSQKSKKQDVSPAQFLDIDMTGKVIHSIELPPLSTSFQLRSFKIMPRAQNSHAIVNAAFLFQFNDTKTEVKFASIVYGNISGSFHHAAKTERYVTGKDIFDNKQLQDTLKVLRDEVRPEDTLLDPSSEFRRKLAVNLFYKAIIDMCPTSRINNRYKSGGQMFDRPVSKGSQLFQTDKSMYPLTKAMPKMEAAIQCSGEAVYSNDLPPMSKEVYAAFVLSTIHSGEISHIDASDALKIDGVLKLIVAKDIPGKNTFIRSDLAMMVEEEEIISSSKILHYGQAVAIIVAKTEFLAKRAAKLVKVEYKNVSEKLPVVSIIEGKNDEARVAFTASLTPTDRGSNVEKIIKGTYHTKSQFHYTMETQTCVVVPIDNVLDVYSSTQWMDAIQIAVADMLNIPESRVNVITRRVGGGFGAKISRAAQVATGCALVAHLMDVPCRFVLPLDTTMAVQGKRASCYSEYEVGVNNKGEIQYLTNNYYEDDGCSRNENITIWTLDYMKNCYDFSRWSLQAHNVLTDLASTTTLRAPGSCESIATIEHIMERIAFETEQDPIAVRIANMRKTDNPLPQLIDEFQKESELDSRTVQVAVFNQENRWKKRAIKMTTMSFPAIFYGNYSALLSVFHSDGSVVVSIGGIEMGQGLNTKVAQVVAFKFGIAFETVTVTPHYTYTTPNNVYSGSSITSECSCYSAAKACDTILQRLQPIKAGMTNPTWKELIAKAHTAEVDLQASYMMSPKEKDLAGYNIFGLTLAEVELDLLTGNFQLIRVDILEDTGQSMNPDIDIGQVEGAFVQGLGLWTMEDIIYDRKTGKILTDSSWNYKVPGALDIPADFRIKLRYNSRNPSGVLGSKAAGEPPLCMAQVVTHALRKAVEESRAESGHSANKWFDIEVPCTNENIVMSADYQIEEFLLQ